MSQVNDDLRMMCKIGYGLGLHTLTDSFVEIERHYDLFFPIKEAHQRLKELEEHINRHEGWGDTIRSVMGDGWCAKQDAEEAAYWEAQR